MTYPKQIHINIDVTNKCDRNCIHCASNSDLKNPIDISCEKVERLLKEIRRINSTVFLSLTGGGEPLMNEQLPDIVKMVYNFQGTKKFSLVTSGFLDNDIEKKRLKKTVKNAPDYKKFKFCLSLHSFNSKAMERFEETFKFLLDSGPKNFCVKTTVAPSDDIHSRLEKLFEKYKVYPFSIGHDVWQRFKTRVFTKKVYDEDFENDSLVGFAHLFDYWYVCPDKKKLILVSTQFLSPQGRAKNLKCKMFSMHRACSAIFRERLTDFHIDSNSSYFPSGYCNTKTYPHMTIGTLDEKIERIIDKRRIFVKNMLGLIISDKRLYDRKNDLCSLCSKIKAEQDALATKLIKGGDNDGRTITGRTYWAEQTRQYIWNKLE